MFKCVGTIVALAEFCKIIKAPCMDALGVITREVEKVTTVQNFDDRLDAARNRTTLAVSPEEPET